MVIASRSRWQARCALWVLCLACVAARSLLGQPNFKRYLEHDSYGSDLPGGTYTSVSSESECQAKCSANAKCTGYVWAYSLPASSPWSNYCWLKQGKLNPRALSSGGSWANKGLMVGVKVADTAKPAASTTAPTGGIIEWGKVFPNGPPRVRTEAGPNPVANCITRCFIYLGDTRRPDWPDGPLTVVNDSCIDTCPADPSAFPKYAVP